MSPFVITGSAMRRARNANEAVRYCASECSGCFDRAGMAETLRNLAEGESASFPALRFVGGPKDPPPVVITRRADAYAN